MFDLGRNDAQILGNDRQVAQATLNRLEEILTRSFYPSADHCGGFFGRDLPVGIEAAEVVDPDDINLLEGFSQAVLPPGEIIPGHQVPTVQWIAPSLASFTEIIRRYSGYDPRRSILFQVK